MAFVPDPIKLSGEVSRLILAQPDLNREVQKFQTAHPGAEVRLNEEYKLMGFLAVDYGDTLTEEQKQQLAQSIQGFALAKGFMVDGLPK